jgi:DNA polymerase-3 subunit delta'
MDLLDKVKGQETAVNILSSQLKSGELSHAYLFVGPEGVGKEFLAREFSKLVLCQDLGKETCPSCKNFDSGAHPDFIFVDGSEGIKIEQVREAVERINLSPNLSRKKVLLFTQGEKMGHEAANALLKTFEEPPVDSIIIITSISEESLPRTIVSRAQVVKLVPFPEETIKAILLSDFKKEEVEEAIKYSGGSLGRARELLKSPEQLSARKLMINEVEKILESDSIIEKFMILERHEKEKNIREFFDIFAERVFQLTGDEIKGENDNLMGSFSLQEKANVSKKLLKIYEKMAYNVNLRLALEQFILENLQREFPRSEI